MRIFKTQSVYDYDSSEWVEFYFIDENEVSAETYFEEMENETVEICEGCGNIIEECSCDTEDCECDCECECLDCVTEKYVSKLQETICPCCQKEILAEFLGEVLSHIR